jgi:membrane-associated phospholipid phosphatase
VTDFHLRVREQRIKPLIITLAAVLLAWLMLWLGQAPPLLVVTAGAGLALVGIIFLVTLRWKISGHAAAISGFTTLCCLLIGRAASPVALTVPLVIWARLRLRRHSLLQTVAGAVVGALTLWAAFYLCADSR